MGKGESNAKKEITPEEWERKLKECKLRKSDMNHLIMNFLVTEGYVDAARAFERESGTAAGVDLSAISDRMEIRMAVQNGDVETAIERVNDLNPEILEERHELLFHLQQQRLIEMIRAGAISEALEFAQEQLAPRGEDNPAFLEELERTMTLLIFENPEASPLADLLEPAQRQRTASELNAAILSAQSQAGKSKLPNLLKLLVWAQDKLAEHADFPRVTDFATALPTVGKADGGEQDGGVAEPTHSPMFEV